MKSIRKTLIEVQEFCKEKDEIYIYGNGKYGQNCKRILDYLNIPVKAFLVSSIEPDSENRKSEGIPVIQWDSSMAKTIQNGGILVAVSKLSHYEVVSRIKGLPYMFYEIPQYSMVEITTKIGCSVNCKYCPQKKLIDTYSKKSDEFYLKMDNFIQILKHIPTVTFIRFCGMCEPFLNPECADMIVYAKEHGFCVDCYSTLVGLKISDVTRVLDAVDDFVPHIPDKNGNAVIEVTDEYISVLKMVLEYKRDGKRLVKIVSVHGEIDDRIKGLIPEDIEISCCMQDRAGNLDGEDLEIIRYEFESPVRCEFCHNRLDSNILLPNGDLLMCCMDYGMEYIFGNLLEDPYEKVVNSTEANRIRAALISGNPKTICNYCMCAEELLG
ncbi:MAG: hypothetical protein HFI69_04405 [Lachnospiraceae bacterium]|nr:hypothetical protein [Lachnospiraceae bacterium]